MNQEQWKELLQSYTTAGEAARETLEGVADHMDTECTTGGTRTVVTKGAQPRPPFREEPTTCERGNTGCTLEHNDAMALIFSRMGLERIVELT